MREGKKGVAWGSEALAACCSWGAGGKLSHSDLGPGSPPGGWCTIGDSLCLSVLPCGGS